MQQVPFVVELNPGTYYLCACGQSKNLPYCDGTHKGSGNEPFKVELQERQTVAICGCRQSASRPFCDGTHLTLA
ncbi:MAG: CDGSH iron-sulfur domain-containing protein [Burkholderiales bacterium]